MPKNIAASSSRLSQTGAHQRGNNDKAAQATIEEARIVLPGIQALFGIRLVAAFNQRFNELSPSHQDLHFVALVLTAISAAIIITRAAYHLIAERYTNSDLFVRLASRLVALAMVPLMLAIVCNVYLLGIMITASVFVSAVTALGLLALLAGLWFIYPFAAATAHCSRK
jgi:Family of unknown function (DUF6328)